MQFWIGVLIGAMIGASVGLAVLAWLFANRRADDAASRARSSADAVRQGQRRSHGARVIECGCGTGQLTNFLSVASRTVIGTDLCLNSLKMATAFKDRNALDLLAGSPVEDALLPLSLSSLIGSTAQVPAGTSSKRFVPDDY